MQEQSLSSTISTDESEDFQAARRNRKKGTELSPNWIGTGPRGWTTDMASGSKDEEMDLRKDSPTIGGTSFTHYSGF